ncbi:MAG TPA: tetratricopeptide repeat protein [Phycisphaerae bacterium]|nr:tetratricopeptide repeat protein [Phycisphaerae bacterium]
MSTSTRLAAVIGLLGVAGAAPLPGPYAHGGWVGMALAAAPADANAAPAAPPAKALVPLEKLEPTIAKPTNPPLPEMPPRAASIVEEARQQLAGQRFVAAIPLLERAAGFAPKDPTIQRLLGQAYLGLRNRGKAETHLENAVRAAPDDLETQLLLGQLAAAQNQDDRAIVYLRTALKCSQVAPDKPLAAEALLTLALLLDRGGYWTGALEAYTTLSKWVDAHGRDYLSRPALREWALRPERLLGRRGGLLLLLGKADEAADLLDRAYRRDRTNGRTATMLVDALLARKDFQRTEKLLLEMGGQPSQRPNLPRLLAKLIEKIDDRKLPERFWKDFRAKYDPDPVIAVGLARIAQERGWAAEALAILQSVLVMRPANAELWRVLCRSYAEGGTFEELYGAARSGLEMDPNALPAIADGIDASAALAKGDGVERRFAGRARKETGQLSYALLYLAGRVATARGKHLLASDLYLRATEKKPDFYRAHEALLDSYLAEKRPDRVDQLLARVDRDAKDTHLPAYFRGKVALRRGDAAAAVTALEQALERNKDDLPTLKLLAEAYAQAGRVEQAADTLQKALAAHSDNEELARRLFEIHLSRRRYREAQLLATELLRGDRESIAGRLMLTELALATGRQKEALILLSQLSRQAPDNADVQLLSIRTMLGSPPALTSKKDFDDAAERLRRLLRVSPDSRPVRTALAELLAAVDKYDEAAGLLGELFEEDRGGSAVAQRYVGALLRARQDQTALRALERFREKQSEDLWGRVLHLELLVKLGRARDARLLGGQWIGETRDDNFRTLFQQELLRVLQFGEDHEQTLTWVEEWIAEKPTDNRLRMLQFNRLRLLGLLGRYDQANRAAEELLAADPFSDPGRLVVGAVLEAKQYDRAADLAGHWLGRTRRFLEQLEALHQAVRGLAEKKAETSPEYEKALQDVPEAVRSDVANAVSVKLYPRATAALDRQIEAVHASAETLRAARIVALAQAEKLDEARREAEAWIKDSPADLGPRRTLVGLLAEAEKNDQADDLVTRWLAERMPKAATQPAEADQTLPWLLETAVRLKLSRRKAAEALELADRYVKIDPNNTDLLSLRSGCLTELGRDDEAMAAMEKAYARQPDDSSLCNNLGYLYAERGIKLADAERMLERALKARPDEVAFEDSLAWIYYKQGRFRDAGRKFQEVLAGAAFEDAEHAVILDHAGDAYYRLGWKDRAVDFWKRALELAGKIKQPTREERNVLSVLPGKVRAVEQGAEPEIAPAAAPPEAPATAPTED